MDKQKLFDKLKELGKIPEGITCEAVTEEYLLSLVTAPAVSESGNAQRLTQEEFDEMTQKALDKKLKDLGIDKIDAKFLKLPGWEENLNDTEKALLDKPANLTDVQKRSIANKQLVALVAPVAKGQVSQRTLALNAESSDAVGRYLVPEQFLAEVSRLLEKFGVMRRNANIFQMTSRTARKPKLLTKPTGGYVNEASAAGESNPTFAQIDFTRHDYAYITGVTKQLLQDSGVDLIGLLAELAAYDFAKGEDAQCFNGSTLTSYLAGNSTLVAVTTTGAGIETINQKKIIEMIFGTAYGESANSKFFWHRSVMAHLLGLADSGGKPIFSLTDQMNIMATRRFLGYPYELVEVMQPITGNDYTGAANDPGAGDVIGYFGDMRRAATLAIRNNIDILVSDTATVGSNSAFEKGLIFWRFEHSHDFNVEQGGALTKLVLGGS